MTVVSDEWRYSKGYRSPLCPQCGADASSNRGILKAAHCSKCRYYWPALPTLYQALQYYSWRLDPMQNEDGKLEFWMLYVSGHKSPAVKHFTREAAEAEAERLIMENRDLTVYVLKAKAMMKADKPVIKTEKLVKAPEVTAMRPPREVVG